MRAATSNSSSDINAVAPNAANSKAIARIASVDAYRGFVMLLILAEVFSSCLVSASVPGSQVWSLICDQQSHSAWVGMSLHDLIQPSFYFLVGVSVVLSGARRSRPRSSTEFLARTAFRSVTLIALGVVLIAINLPHWEWHFFDTLAQIGLAYPFLVLVAARPKSNWLVCLAAILIGYWLWFAVWPLPTSVDFESVGVSAGWLRQHGLDGFAGHWQKNGNVAAEFDRWFLNLFPRNTPHVGYESGLTTLNFIPSVGTMIFGLLAGDVLMSGQKPAQKIRWFAFTGSTLIVVASMLHVLGVSPIVKAIWTPGWVLFSGGWCVLLLAAFFKVVDCKGYRRLALPLRVVGMNSVFAYAMHRAYPAFAFNSFRRLLGPVPFRVLGTAYEPALYGTAIFSAYLIVLWLMYRRGIFVRV